MSSRISTQVFYSVPLLILSPISPTHHLYIVTLHLYHGMLSLFSCNLYISNSLNNFLLLVFTEMGFIWSFSFSFLVSCRWPARCRQLATSLGESLRGRSNDAFVRHFPVKGMLCSRQSEGVDWLKMMGLIRCRKHRSRCSRTRPSCDQCIQADVPCQYLDGPGDLESTALRDRFEQLEGQIQSLLYEFDIIEELVYERDHNAQVRADALKTWYIRSENGQGISIDTNMHNIEDIYDTLIQFALDNSKVISPCSSSACPPLASDTTTTTTIINNNNNQSYYYSGCSASLPLATPSCLIRNNTIFPRIKLGHFTSLRLSSATLRDEGHSAICTKEPDLPPDVRQKLIQLYPTCLLHGSISECSAVLDILLSDNQHPHHQQQLSNQRAAQFLHCSIMCYMLLHAYWWHPKVFRQTMSEEECLRTAQQYYHRAKEHLSSLYFEEPNVLVCHGVCNLVLYHIESGNTSVTYLYSGMAVRLAVSLELYRDGRIESLAREQNPSTECIQPELFQRYVRSVRWFLYFLDTAVSHFHNKPYEVHMDRMEFDQVEDGSVEPDQGLLQAFEFQACQITRCIRRTCFTSGRQTVPYGEIARIEARLLSLEASLHGMQLKDPNSLWGKRCKYVNWIRYHGLWILLHQTYLPHEVSVDRCTRAAFALVELFDAWSIDCYFRPCVHELKQASEILKFHVDNDTAAKTKALEGLKILLESIFCTAVRDIARTRPFIQDIERLLTSNDTTSRTMTAHWASFSPFLPHTIKHTVYFQRQEKGIL